MNHDSDIVKKGEYLYERLTDLSPEEVTLDELMKQWDVFADAGEVGSHETREEVEEALAAHLADEKKARNAAQERAAEARAFRLWEVQNRR